MSDFRICTCVLGPISTNCYIVYTAGGKEAVVVDPGDNSDYISNKCRELGVIPAAVLLTHGHFDHMMAARDIARSFRAKIYVSVEDDLMLADPSLNLSGTCDTEQVSFHGDVLIQDGQELEFLGRRWSVMATPGHTSGSVCFYIPEEEVLLAGDTLFEDSCGRTDLPTGSMSQMVDSIVNKLFPLPDDTLVYPGHGNPTTIGHEKMYNPIAVYNRRRK